jgi:putative endonuclease
MQKKSLGFLGENLALSYLKNKGYRFVARNFRSRFGEIDLILKDKNILVFVEVKTRLNDTYGTPEEAITWWKLNSLIKTANYFKLLHSNLPESLRIDVIAIMLNFSGSQLVSLRHIKNITL